VSRYLYALVRCVPDPRTGEYINIGAIAGNPKTGDWAVRQVTSDRRALKLAGAFELAAVHGLLARVEEEIDSRHNLLELGEGEPLSAEWLERLHHDHRNVVQLSVPTPMIAESAETALDLIFSRLIIDPVSQPRDFITKHRVLAELREAYWRADVDPKLIRPKVELFVGSRVHTPVDFAVANGRALQLTQAWSFQRGGVAEIATQVKAWGYALNRVKDGEAARVIAADNHVSELGKDVDLQVAVAPPRTDDQRRVYEEAEQVFAELNVAVHSLDEVDAIGSRAAELVQAH
jgi:hypothetical protein